MLSSELCRFFEMKESELLRFARTCPYRYKEFHIPKANGGSRKIAQPSRELKSIQRLIVARYLNKLPVHPAATAYNRGDSVLSNARQHRGNQYILKMDFSDFFNSLFPRNLWLACESVPDYGFSQVDMELLTNLLFYKPKSGSGLLLSIGAPSSPFISNAVMHCFDGRVVGLLADQQIWYTRYADDMTFSTNRRSVLNSIPTLVSAALRESNLANLKVNERKTVFLSRKGNRTVTGLVIDNDGGVSVGRERKRELHVLVHRFANGRLSESELSKLGGHLAFLKPIDPRFFDTLEKKYGVSIESILKKAGRVWDEQS